MMPLLAAGAFVASLLGGLLVLRFKQSLPYAFAFAAGSIVAVAFLDLLPESLELADSLAIPVVNLMLALLAAFFAYSLIERFFATHHLHEHEGHAHVLGPIGAGSMVVHSLLDGVAVGAVFQVNPTAGLVVGLAVVVHAFTDGINTVMVMLRNKQPAKRAFAFLVMAALAPALGILFASLVEFSPTVLAYLFAVFVGEFLYIGAATLIPETRHTPKSTIVTMLLGVTVITLLTILVH